MSATARRMFCNDLEITPETILRTRRHFARLQIDRAKDYYGPGKRGEQLGKTPADMCERL